MENNEKEKQETEFLETINSFIKYMIKEYDKPKDGRTLLVIASDDNKSCVSFIGRPLEGCISIANAMMNNDDIDSLLSVSVKSVKTVKDMNTESLKSIMGKLDKTVDDFLNGLTKGGKNE